MVYQLTTSSFLNQFSEYRHLREKEVKQTILGQHRRGRGRGAIIIWQRGAPFYLSYQVYFDDEITF